MNDEMSPRARALLEAAKGQGGPSSSQLAKLGAAVGVMGAAAPAVASAAASSGAAAATGAAATGAAAGLGILSTKVIVASAVVVLGLSGTLIATLSPPASEVKQEQRKRAGEPGPAGSSAVRLV